VKPATKIQAVKKAGNSYAISIFSRISLHGISYELASYCLAVGLKRMTKHSAARSTSNPVTTTATYHKNTSGVTCNILKSILNKRSQEYQ